MEILNIQNHKRNYLPLLLLADEQEAMINRYLDRGELFALMDPELKTVCVVTQEENRVFEIKNLATVPEAQNQGYGKGWWSLSAAITEGAATGFWLAQATAR